VRGADATEQFFRRLVLPLWWDGKTAFVGGLHDGGIDPCIGNASSTVVHYDHVALDAPTLVLGSTSTSIEA
jgi:hypothetical protein